MTSCRLVPALLVLVSLAAGPALAAWPHDPTDPGLALRPLQATAFIPAVCEDGAGGFYCTWDENSEILVQHVDAAGRLLWGPGGVAVASLPSNRWYPSICADGAGGAILAWQDARAGNMDIYVQRVNPAGASQWTAGGVALCSATNTQSGVRVASDGAGGAVVTWIDWRSGVQRVYARAVSPSGVPQWAADGIEITTGTTGTQVDPQVTWLPAGQYALVWQDWRSGEGDVYAQMLTPEGARFAAGGIAICTAAGDQSSARLCRDSGTGFGVAWVDQRGASADIYAQRVSYGGYVLWAANGVAACVQAALQDKPSIAPDPTGGLYVSWQDERNAVATGLDIFVQRLSAAGSAMWAANGIAACDAIGSQINVRSIPDGAGGVILAWADVRGFDQSNYDVYAQRIGSSGNAAWNALGTPVNVSPRTLQNQAVQPCTDGRGGLIVAWTDQVPGTSTSRSYAARVDEWGYLAAEPWITSVTDVPNDQGGQVKLSWSASPLDTDPLFRNIASYSVYRSVPQEAFALARLAGEKALLAGESPGAGSPPRFLQTRSAAGDYYWEFEAAVNAAHLEAYSEVVTTTGDSIGGSNPLAAFMVMARNSSGTMWWTSEPDSGYSVDDLAPATPAPFTGQYAAGAAALHWNPNVEPDLAGYELYRGASVAFVPGPGNLVAALADTGYVDAAGGPFVYKLLAVDSHGNRSPVATLVPAGTLDVGGAAPAAAFLAPPSPNPSRAGATLRFGLAARGEVKLALYDAQGRLVRSLAAGLFDAGEHAVAFDGRDHTGRRLAPGLYLARLVAPGFSATRRLALVD